MNYRASKPEWDTPANGDFASYIERLTAYQSAPQHTMHPSAPIAGTASRATKRVSKKTSATHPSAAHNTPAPPAVATRSTGATVPFALSPEVAQALVPLQGLLGLVRRAIVVVAVIQVLLMAMFSIGTVGGLVLWAAAWWALTWLMGQIAKAAPPGAGQSNPSLSQLHELLQQLTRERTNGNKK